MISPGSEIDYLVATLVQFVEKLDHANVVRRNPNSGKNVACHLPNGIGNLKRVEFWFRKSTTYLWKTFRTKVTVTLISL